MNILVPDDLLREGCELEIVVRLRRIESESDKTKKTCNEKQQKRKINKGNGIPIRLSNGDSTIISSAIPSKSKSSAGVGLQSTASVSSDFETCSNSSEKQLDCDYSNDGMCTYYLIEKDATNSSENLCSVTRRVVSKPVVADPIRREDRGDSAAFVGPYSRLKSPLITFDGENIHILFINKF